MVDSGVLLVVDAFDGPMPQTRFVLRKRRSPSAARRSSSSTRSTTSRARIPMRVHEEVLDLFIELEANEAAG